MFPGHCLEGIGDAEKHPPPPRDIYGGRRVKGWYPGKWNDTQPYTPSANGREFWNPGAQNVVNLHRPVGNNKSHHKQYSKYSAFHFHNWFTDGDTIRFKYKTFGHPDKNVHQKATC